MRTVLRELLYGPLLVDHIDFQAQGHTPLDFNLAGNRLQVELPLPFSKDMPPTKLTPDFDLQDPQAFGDARKRALLKVIWDIPRTRVWQPDYGSVVMTLWVQKNPDPRRFDIFKRDELILAVQENLKSDYDEYNEKTWEEGLAAGRLSIDVGDDLISSCRDTDEYITDHRFNHDAWIRHIIVGIETHSIFCAPVGDEHYISVDFEFMPNTGLFAAEFASMCDSFTERVMDSVHIERGKDQERGLALDKGITVDADQAGQSTIMPEHAPDT